LGKLLSQCVHQKNWSILEEWLDRNPIIKNSPFYRHNFIIGRIDGVAITPSCIIEKGYASYKMSGEIKFSERDLRTYLLKTVELLKLDKWKQWIEKLPNDENKYLSYTINGKDKKKVEAKRIVANSPAESGVTSHSPAESGVTFHSPAKSGVTAPPPAPALPTAPPLAPKINVLKNMLTEEKYIFKEKNIASTEEDLKSNSIFVLDNIYVSPNYYLETENKYYYKYYIEQSDLNVEIKDIIYDIIEIEKRISKTPRTDTGWIKKELNEHKKKIREELLKKEVVTNDLPKYFQVNNKQKGTPPQPETNTEKKKTNKDTTLEFLKQFSKCCVNINWDNKMARCIHMNNYVEWINNKYITENSLINENSPINESLINEGEKLTGVKAMLEELLSKTKKHDELKTRIKIHLVQINTAIDTVRDREQLRVFQEKYKNIWTLEHNLELAKFKSTCDFLSKYISQMYVLLNIGLNENKERKLFLKNEQNYVIFTAKGQEKILNRQKKYQFRLITGKKNQQHKTIESWNTHYDKNIDRLQSNGINTKELYTFLENYQNRSLDTDDLTNFLEHIHTLLDGYGDDIVSMNGLVKEITEERLKNSTSEQYKKTKNSIKEHIQEHGMFKKENFKDDIEAVKALKEYVTAWLNYIKKSINYTKIVPRREKNK